MPTLAFLHAVARHLGVPFAPRLVPAAPFRAWVALGDGVYRWTRLALPYHYTAEFYSARIAYDTARARRELGWVPRYEIPESIARTVSWLREKGLV
jgi:nucleoside-diphosphate-sugar epimerase